MTGLSPELVLKDLLPGTWEEMPRFISSLSIALKS